MRYIVILILCPIITKAQVKFESGYYVDTNGNKNECQIKNFDWQYNPTEIEIVENGESKKLTLNDILEFSIGLDKKYLNATVSVDTSSDNLLHIKLSSTIRPLWQKQRVFVKVLVEGQMNLYSLNTESYTRFYYRHTTDSITPLVYKQYFVSRSLVGTNKQYLMQLEKLLDCGGLSRNIKSKYTARDLSALVVKYNQCTNSTVSNYKFEKQIKFHVKATIGLNYSSYKASIDGALFPTEADFGYKLTPRFGAELEMMLPYWDNRWSLLFDPNYRTYKSNTEDNGNYYSVDYQSIEMPFGARAHFYVKQNCQIFVDILYIADIHLGNTPISMDGTEFPEKSAPNYGLGIGFSSKRISFSARFNSLRDLAAEYISLNDSFKNFSIITTYKLF